ncbi:MAG TPA: 4-alpha-glucanotransferase [Thermoanaerobaculia bacterium]|nr:4-alpha-glucanotransferase [Thermoanaerobaculia bacterium]
MANEHEDLRELARLYGVQTSYTDAMGRHVEARPEALLGVLRALGAPLEDAGEAEEALRARREELAERVLEPVVVAWDGHAHDLAVRLSGSQSSLGCHLDLESGERRGWVLDVESLQPAGEGTRRLTLPESLPPGYHRLRFESGGRSTESLVISAPSRAYSDRRSLWGVFLPLYALRTARSWGAGDFSDLETLAEWTAGLGGGVVATLPMLPAFLDEPFEPSPYAPVSRLFWNEIYLDPRRLPDFDEHPAARRLLESPDLQNEIEALQREPQVDYARLASLKRRVLEEMAHRFFAHPGERYDEFERFVRGKRDLEIYAGFRAVGDRRGEPWQCWPERLCEGSLAAADFDEDDYRYHLWTQWACEQQIAALAQEARRRGPGLYLDLPLGVHSSSFDVWRERDLFARQTAAGAPPDSFFTKGQDWGFPPLSPERLRESGYSYLIDCFRHHLRHAGLLRIDHVMQLHRLFWIPQGMEAADGVYVTYPADELYAVLTLESHRHQAMIVGENLGTVPPEVDDAMDRHDVLGMYVVQYELQPGSVHEGGLREPPERTAASLNTHDMPTFPAFLEAKDVDDLESLGFFDADQARAERERRAEIRRQMESEIPEEDRGDRESTDRAVLRKRLEHLAASPARMVLVSLEDLWGEIEPQNVPGTQAERPNWRRKARLSFEEFSQKPEVTDVLRRVDELRRRR